MPTPVFRHDNMIWVVSNRAHGQFVAAFRTQERAQSWVDDAVPIGPDFEYDIRMSWIIE